MFNRRRFAVVGLAILSLTGSVATAGSINYEGLEGAQCQVTTQQAPGLEVETRYDEVSQGSVTARVRIPFGDPTGPARVNCVEFAEQDQGRQHFVWLLEMYQAGVITRDALQNAADKLGMTLAAETPAQEKQGASLVIE